MQHSNAPHLITVTLLAALALLNGCAAEASDIASVSQPAAPQPKEFVRSSLADPNAPVHNKNLVAKPQDLAARAAATPTAASPAGRAAGFEDGAPSSHALGREWDSENAINSPGPAPRGDQQD